MVMLLHASVLMACKCAPVIPIDQELVKKYDVIFMGRIDSIAPCSTNGISVAYFTISELYKGTTGKNVAVHFDCLSSCMMSFARNEEWIIYAIYQRFGVVSVKLCSHTRKHFASGEQDFYRAASKRTFEEEQSFLKNTLQLQPFTDAEQWNKDQQELKPHNEQPSNNSKIYLLLISFAVMILIYILTRKKRKKNG